MPYLEHELVDEVSDGLDPSQDVEAVGEGDAEPPDETINRRALDAACEAHRVGGGPKCFTKLMQHFTFWYQHPIISLYLVQMWALDATKSISAPGMT